MFLINGCWQQGVPADDRAVQFGDGCFTTAWVVAGEVQMLAQHIQRLQQACARLAIPSPDWQQLAQEMRQMAAASLPDNYHQQKQQLADNQMLSNQLSGNQPAYNPPASDGLTGSQPVYHQLIPDQPVPDHSAHNQPLHSPSATEQQAVLKVIISRGSGGRGYATAGCQHSRRILWLAAYPWQYAQWRGQGITLALSPVRLGHNALLAGIKHLNRLEQVLIRQQLPENAQDALVLDSEGMLVECCAANLFWRQGDTVFTPQVDLCGVNGLMRQRIIALLQEAGWQVEQGRWQLSQLAYASEMLICNALMPVLPVKEAHQWLFSSRRLYQFLLPRLLPGSQHNSISAPFTSFARQAAGKPIAGDWHK